ncbi:single-stranded DNA-binding protein [Jiangella muralis]|uniref:single-stranded DNA-binding protein n=1 Tax=Jiangella muralis TaxID=702383 RepID=UPI00069D0B36|nr:single-stranded DNA-binding protein [Jiangella muralis]
MAIDTLESLSGFIAANPQLSKTERGDARFYVRVGHEQYLRNEDGSTTRLDTTYHHLLMFGRAAERAYAVFRKGDRFIAEGHVRVHDNGDEFIALRIGHDSSRTLYTVQRSGGSRKYTPITNRESGVDLTSVRERAGGNSSPRSRPDAGPFRALTVTSTACSALHGRSAGY